MTLQDYNQSVHDYSNRVCRFVDKVLVDSTVAKDITQEAYLKLWERKETVDGTKVRAWLFTTAYRLSLDYLQKQKRYVKEEHLPEWSVEQESPDLKKIVNEALVLLNEVQRSILLLKDYEGYSYAEIGEMLQVNESQVKVYLFRARKRIKEHIGELRWVI
jgi:RNA polymerase sigma-70 factor (ECF subfamily)